MDPNRDSAFGPIPPSRRWPMKHRIHRLPTEAEVRVARLAALGFATDAEGSLVLDAEGRPVAPSEAPDST